jgi:uncharacterized protein
MTQKTNITGVGIGLRRDFIEEVAENKPNEIDFFELAPENYMERGGLTVKLLQDIAKDYPLSAHGLSLSIGSTYELNWDHLKKLKAFLRKFNIPFFSDHLCFSSVNAHVMHDLLPLPFTHEAVKHVSERARIVQDFLELPFALENVSYYLLPAKPEMSELEFIQEVLHRSGVSLMLDVNNIYVNAVNHGIDAKHYLKELSNENILQLHIAGHLRERPDFIIDTHGDTICKDVWELLSYLGEQIALPPVLIERDFNIPELKELLEEVAIARNIYNESHNRKAKVA